MSKSLSFYDLYVLKEELGHGSFGFVYRAEKFGDNFAVKRVNKSNFKGKPEILEKIKGELNILKKTENKHIMRVVDFHEDEKYYYVVTDYIERGELYEKLLLRDSLSE
jgi:serine/threonine protein kinase